MSGVLPISRPSIVTFEPAVDDEIDACPVVKPLPHDSRCSVCTPAEISTGTTRVPVP